MKGKNQFFKAPETIQWLDLIDPDPRHILGQIYTTALIPDRA